MAGLLHHISKCNWTPQLRSFFHKVTLKLIYVQTFEYRKHVRATSQRNKMIHATLWTHNIQFYKKNCLCMQHTGNGNSSMQHLKTVSCNTMGTETVLWNWFTQHKGDTNSSTSQKNCFTQHNWHTDSFMQHLWAGSVALPHRAVSYRRCWALAHRPGVDASLTMNWLDHNTDHDTDLLADIDLNTHVDTRQLGSGSSSSGCSSISNSSCSSSSSTTNWTVILTTTLISQLV